MSAPSLRLFISHSSQDIAWCQEFVAVLRAAGYTCFFDHDSIPGSAEWLDTIQGGIQQCDLCVLILSPVAWASIWVKREWQLALRLNKPILPVEFQSTTEANGSFLRQYQWVKASGLAAATAAQLTITEMARLRVASGATPTMIPATFAPTHSFSIPTRLARLGFVGAVVNGVEVIVPPVCNVSAGTFTMGSDRQHDPLAYDDEIPQYDIAVPAFQIGVYPLTVSEYACAVSAGVVKAPQTSRGVSWQSQQQRLDHPVVCITWFEACAYAAWLAKATGQAWRLPTEVEWEKAARWDKTKQMSRIYPWGDQWDKERANTTDGIAKTTTPIGNFVDKEDASPYGAHDMIGNVWEWTSSIYIKNYPYRSDKAKEEIDILSSRVLRGRAWDYDPDNVRAALRSKNYPDIFEYVVGVRLAIGIES